VIDKAGRWVTAHNKAFASFSLPQKVRLTHPTKLRRGGTDRPRPGHRRHPPLPHRRLGFGVLPLRGVRTLPRRARGLRQPSLSPMPTAQIDAVAGAAVGPATTRPALPAHLHGARGTAAVSARSSAAGLQRAVRGLFRSHQVLGRQPPLDRRRSGRLLSACFTPGAGSCNAIPTSTMWYPAGRWVLRTAAGMPPSPVSFCRYGRCPKSSAGSSRSPWQRPGCWTKSQPRSGIRIGTSTARRYPMPKPPSPTWHPMCSRSPSPITASSKSSKTK